MLVIRLVIIILLACGTGILSELLSTAAYTDEMNEYRRAYEQRGDSATLEEMEIRAKEFELVLESANNSNFDEAHFAIHALVIPILVIASSVVFLKLGLYFSSMVVVRRIAICIFTATLIASFGYSYQPFVNITFLVFGLFGGELRKLYR